MLNLWHTVLLRPFPSISGRAWKRRGWSCWHLFRALDRMDLSAAEIPQRPLRQLFELDADFAEALWGLDQPAGSLNLSALVGDTQAALDQLPEAHARFRKNLPRRVHATLANLNTAIRKTLDPREAYNMLPGRDPQNG
jgi:hypothetical protein